MEGPVSVLLIEDNPADVRLVEEYTAESEAARVDLAVENSLRDGIDRAKRDEFQVVLLDLGLPGSSGIETLEKFRREEKDTPVIVLTGLEDEQTALKAVEHDAEDYLIKNELTPFALTRSIRYAIERSRMRKELVKARKMEALGKLAGGIAHDFNNLMTGVIGYAELAQNELPDDHELQDDLRAILKAGQQAASLTDQILAFSRRQVMQPRVVKMNELVEGMHDMLRGALPEIIQLNIELDPDAGSVMIDPARFEQVIFNLAINAKDAMPEGGELSIVTGEEALSEEDTRGHPEAAPGSYVVVSVSDTGVGMDEDTQEQIFEPFFSTKREKDGTGLGLSTAMGTVTQSNGHIWVSSVRGEGTEMKVYLPRTSEDPEEDRDSVADAGVPRGKGEKVLLVEDERVVRDFVSQALADLGYQVTTAADADSAFQLLEEGELSDIELLVSDVVLPDLRGDLMAQQLQDELSDLKILLVTGYTDELLNFGEEGMEDVEVMTKPFTVEKLGNRIDAVLAAPARKM